MKCLVCIAWVKKWWVVHLQEKINLIILQKAKLMDWIEGMMTFGVSSLLPVTTWRSKWIKMINIFQTGEEYQEGDRNGTWGSTSKGKLQRKSWKSLVVYTERQGWGKGVGAWDTIMRGSCLITCSSWVSSSCTCSTPGLPVCWPRQWLRESAALLLCITA